ncbi:hypothetical protein HK102_009163, partial [Quaeritorhiza haematococci]
MEPQLPPQTSNPGDGSQTGGTSGSEGTVGMSASDTWRSSEPGVDVAPASSDGQQQQQQPQQQTGSPSSSSVDGGVSIGSPVVVVGSQPPEDTATKAVATGPEGSVGTNQKQLPIATWEQVLQGSAETGQSGGVVSDVTGVNVVGSDVGAGATKGGTVGVPVSPPGLSGVDVEVVVNTNSNMNAPVVIGVEMGQPSTPNSKPGTPATAPSLTSSSSSSSTSGNDPASHGVSSADLPPSANTNPFDPLNPTVATSDSDLVQQVQATPEEIPQAIPGAGVGLTTGTASPV